MSEDSGEINTISENKLLTNIAATKANDELGSERSPEGLPLLSTKAGTRILSKYEESEANRENSFKDPMTELLNRRGLLEEYKLGELSRERLGVSESNVLIALDLIGLKKLNNELTSEGADKLIKEATSSLLQQIRKTDLAGRWGGDEFLLILFGADQEAAVAVIQKVLNNVPDRVNYNIGYKVVQPNDDPELQMNDVMKQMDNVKLLGGVDETGRAIGIGVVVNLNDLKTNV